MKKVQNETNIEGNYTEDDSLVELINDVEYLLHSDSNLNFNVKYLLQKVELLSKEVADIMLELHGHE